LNAFFATLTDRFSKVADEASASDVAQPEKTVRSVPDAPRVPDVPPTTSKPPSAPAK
jgi:hypothetical protein